MLVKDHLNTWCCFLQLPWLLYGRPCSLQEILDTVHWKLMIISVTELIHFLAFFHLKNKCYAQFQVHNLKSMKEFFHTAQYSSIVLSTVFPFKPPPPKYSVLIGQPTHARTSSAPCISTQLCRIFSFHLESLLPWTLANYANVWHGDIVWCREVMEIQAGLLMRHFGHFRFSMGETSSCWCRLLAF